MNPDHRWQKISSKCLTNLWVLFVDDMPVGMIDKPADRRGDKNFWRLYRGVGENNEFMCHTATKTDAIRLMEEFFVTGTKR